ncbi:unnamed protein product [Rhizoctonia solani]|uniref:Uncharacterized protein n=1 Tax=Rhizoctonia solani TaxID=456999 RepID=A0A8H3H8T7_9AGAM|nr:unnamed protein product [Rhizoctonia solani]
MTDVEERPGRQLATNLRELMKQVDIRTGTDRDTNPNKERERDNESVASASVRDIFARARTNLPTPASRITRPRGLSIDSDVLSTNDGDDASTVESTPIARVPPSAAALNALRQRLETDSTATSDLTGWDRSARSLLTTRGQASQSRLNVYDDGSNLMDEDLNQVPALTVSHVDFAPSVSSTSHTSSVATPRQRPPIIPRGPSLQSASIADRLAGIPDDGLEFDDTDREDFDRNLMGDDSEDLLHQENDLLRSSSPPPPDSPVKPAMRPISGSWENVMPEGSVMSLPNLDSRKPARKQELGSSGGSGGSGSKLLQAIQDEEDSYQRSMHEKSGSTVVGDETQRPSTSPDKANPPASRLSLSGRSRLPMAKASTSPASKPSPGLGKVAPAPGSKPSPADKPAHRPTRSDITFPSSPQGGPVRSVSRPDAPETSRIPRLSSPGVGIAPNRFDSPQSPVSPRKSIVAPVTPSRIPRASMHSPRSSIDGSPLNMTRSVSAATPSRTRATSALGANPPVTTPSRTRATSAIGVHGSPENDVDRERAWGKQLPKLTHANLRMRHDQMDTVGSYLSGLSPDAKGEANRSRPTTPSFVGYSRKGTSEVSSSNGSAGSDEDTHLRRSRKLSIADGQGTKSGRELRGSPSAPSVARSPVLKRASSLKTPSKTGAANMRHSMSFTGSPSATGSDRGMSPINSPRKLSNRHSADFVSPKEYQALRERDWGRPAHSRALGLANVRTRGGTPGVRNRVISGGSMAGSDAGLTSPVARERTGAARPRPHTVHLGGSYTNGGGQTLEQLGREPLGGDFEDDEMSESVLEWQRRQQSIEDLQEETEVELEITRPESPSPPSPSRSIPLPDSPPPPTRPLQRGTTPPPRPQSRSQSVPKFQLHPPQEPSVSVFGDGMVGESTTVESSRERRDSLRRDSSRDERERETTVREERRAEKGKGREEPSEDEEPDSPKHLTFAQPESPTISFMDTLPPLPEPPSDDEHSVVQPVRPSVNTRVNRIAREPSPGSGSGSEKTPRASTMSLRVPSPRVPSPPQPETAKEAPTSSMLGLDPTPAQADTLEVPRPIRTRSRSNTLGTTLPRVDVNTVVSRDEIDSAATPIATRLNPPVREAKKPAEAKQPRKSSPLASQLSSPAVANSATLPSTSSSSPAPPPLQARHSDPQLPPMMSQKGKEILQRMQQHAASLARDLEVEGKQPVPQGDEVKAGTEQIVQLSAAARAERERLEKLRLARGPKETVKVVEVPVRRRSISWILFSILVSLLCVWLSLYCSALSHHATNVYLDPLYPVLYGGDANPLRSARTIDTFPTAWHMYLVPKSGIQHWLTPISQKLWALPTNWRPS